MLPPAALPQRRLLPTREPPPPPLPHTQVLLTGTGAAKIADVGLSRLTRGGVLSASMGVVGTFAWCGQGTAAGWAAAAVWLSLPACLRVPNRWPGLPPRPLPALPGRMAPEMIIGATITTATDIFSFGGALGLAGSRGCTIVGVDKRRQACHLHTASPTRPLAPCTSPARRPPPAPDAVLLWEIVTGEQPQRGEMRMPLVPDECPQAVADIISRCGLWQPEGGHQVAAGGTPGSHARSRTPTPPHPRSPSSLPTPPQLHVG